MTLTPLAQARDISRRAANMADTRHVELLHEMIAAKTKGGTSAERKTLTSLVSSVSGFDLL